VRFRLTTASSDLDHHKVRAPNSCTRLLVSTRAPHEWCQVTDADRWAALAQSNLGAIRRFTFDDV
jgi:hypothetical protein